MPGFELHAPWGAMTVATSGYSELLLSELMVRRSDGQPSDQEAQAYDRCTQLCTL